ncbi:MAG: endonuclease/exonuclease/phosphatase family protein [Bacteroidales bacterium]|nr:endonuclease/exonuclease/phosphatase family protein [Bacteroidales bacterium]
MVYRISFIVLLLASLQVAEAQNQVRAGLIGFYNLENLFDTINTEGVLDEEFTPEGPNKWTGSRYLEKLDNMALVISRIGEDDGWSGGPAVLGVSEIENRSVLEDLAAHPLLKESNYQIVHYDSPDLRGVDVALMYRPRFFRVTASASPSLDLTNDEGEPVYTRDQLVVSGIFDGEPMHFIVGHWPSRSGGELTSRPRRIAAAELSRRLVDSLLAIDGDAKVFVMGDFNDDPVDESMRKILRASGKPDRLKEGELFNTMFPLFRKGIGSLYYRDGVNLFDQIIITPSLLGSDYSSYRFLHARVFNASFLLQKDGQYRGYPLRSFVGTVWQGGYSDHFPVYVIIVKSNSPAN